MNQRLDPFASLQDLPAFETKPKRQRAVEENALDRIADENGFHSRQAVRAQRVPKRKPRVHRTGRNVSMNIKVTQETQDHFYKLAEERKLVLGALLAQALEALERAGAQHDARPRAG